MPEQEWFCELCKVEGVVRYEPGAGVYEVSSKLEADHQRQSPNCTREARYLRAVNKKTEEKMKDYQEVPIRAAQTIAENFAKQEVIVLAIDREFNKVHITTFGVNKQYSDNAAVTGDFLAEVLEVRKPKLYFELIERAKQIWRTRK